MIDLIRRIGLNVERFSEPFVLLGIRVYMWSVFYFSGKQKFDNYLNDDWESTLFLFEEVHPVPGIPVEFAAFAGTAGELALSVLLLLGLFGRFAALGLIVMTGVIEFSFQYNDADYMTDPAHIMWALLLAAIFARGSGMFSIDRFAFLRGRM